MKACDRYLNAIHELVDGTLGPIRRAELELHLESCDGCRALARDLQAIASAAEALPPLNPPERVWSELSGRLRAEGRAAPGPAPVVRARSMGLLAIAAALALLVAGSLYLLQRQRSSETPPAPVASTATPAPSPDSAAPSGNAAPASPVQTVDVATELALTEKHFQNAIEQASTADPATAAVLQKNLLVVNEAIAESRKALEANPQSGSTQLYEMLKQKIRFLQDTIALMNSMRQGDAAGAAQIVEGGKS